MVGAHTTNPTMGRIGSHTFRGVAFLRTDFGCGYFCVKNKLDFWGKLTGLISEYGITTPAYGYY